MNFPSGDFWLGVAAGATLSLILFIWVNVRPTIEQRKKEEAKSNVSIERKTE